MAEMPNVQLFFTNPGLFHIAETILIHLDIKNLVKCREVSQSWTDLIDQSQCLSKKQIKALKQKLIKLRDKHCQQWNKPFKYDGLGLPRMLMAHQNPMETNKSKPFSNQIYNDLMDKTNLKELKIVVGFLNNLTIPKETMFNGSTMVLIFKAIQAGNDLFVKVILDKIDLNSLDKTTGVPMNNRHRARQHSLWTSRPGDDPVQVCDYCNFQSKSLLELESHGSSKDHLNNTKLSLRQAIKFKKVNIIKLVLNIHDKLEINLEVQDMTLLQHACKYGSLEVVKFLISKWNLDNDKQRYLIHYAASGGHLDIVEFMLEQDLDFANARDKDGETPLHCACTYGHLGLVQFFVNESEMFNINLNARNKDGLTPFDVAFKFGYMRIVQFFLDESMKKCIDVNVENEMSLMSKKQRFD